MHSSGRGEDSPEPYRGTVLPSGQNQPLTYGDQVQPAAGTPWGEPPAGAQPAPADATQMLPPYPAGTPAPGAGPQPPGPFPVLTPPQPGTPPPMPPGPPPGMAAPGAPGAPAAPGAMPHVPGPGVAPAEATQMLPPYPAGPAPDVAAAQQPAGPPPAAMPPAPPLPPQAGAAQPPHQPFPGGPQMFPGGQPQAVEEPVEATQAMPLSIFQEQSYEGGYDAPPHGGPAQDAYGQSPAYGHAPGQPQDDPDGFGGGQDLGGDYDHLFRSDVPSPAQTRPHIIQPGGRGPAAAAYGQGGYEPAGYDRNPDPHAQYGQYGYDDEGGGRRKMSPKVLIGIVVAGCVVAGLVVGGLLNSGGKASADNAGGSHSTAPGTTGATPSGSATPDDAAKQQAQALDALLQTSGSSRSSVVNAVESIKNCSNLGGAASDLRSASQQRNGLVTQLGTLSVDKLPGHADLVDALTKAWHASAAADLHYAAWADQVAHNHKLCKGGHARSTDEVQTANRESGTATEQKKRAVRLWNHIADQYGLTKRQYSQL